MTNKIDITSTVIEKGIDLAKDFLNKLIIPTVEETGLLIREKITMWRFNNQVKMLIKAKENCENHGINLKTVSLKVLCPLLDYASLEENEILQDKWANLLTNMVDSSQNIENHVFPYLLSQVSVEEFLIIEAVNKIRVERVLKYENELLEFQSLKLKIEMELKDQIAEIEKQSLKDGIKHDFDIQRKKWEMEKEVRELESQERVIKHSIKQSTFIPRVKLKEFEISNLVRLGIVKSIPRPYAYIDKHKIQNNPDSEYLYIQDIEITMEAEEDDLILTELGELFVAACNKIR